MQTLYRVLNYNAILATVRVDNDFYFIAPGVYYYFSSPPQIVDLMVLIEEVQVGGN